MMRVVAQPVHRFETLGSDLIRKAAARYRDRPALIADHRQYSFRDLDERSNRLANGLIHLGVRPSDRVAVLRWNDPEHFEIQLALLKIGAAMVNINPRASASDMAWQLADSSPKVILASSQFTPSLLDIADDVSQIAHVFVFGGGDHPWADYGSFVAQGSIDSVAVNVSPDDLGYLRYTSGTTGTPKGVVHTQHTIAAVTRNLLLDFIPDMKSSDVFLAAQGVFHGAGWFILPCLARGVPFVLPSHFDPQYLWRLAERHHANIIKTVPTILQRMLASAPSESSLDRQIRTLIYGASPIPAETLRHGLDRWGRVFVQLYGQAESPMTITVLDKHEHDPDLLYCVGRPCTFVDVEVRPVDLHEEGSLDVSGIGEIVVRADHNMVGYWRGPDKMPHWPWPDEWVRTGDLGRVDHEGRVFLVDRKGDMIISGGLNVYPNEVEQVIYRHPEVNEAVVVGVADERWGEAVIAFVAAREGATVDPQEIASRCREGLAHYKVPQRVAIVDVLPKNAAGKIMRRTTRDQDWQSRHIVNEWAATS